MAAVPIKDMRAAISWGAVASSWNSQSGEVKKIRSDSGPEVRGEFDESSEVWRSTRTQHALSASGELPHRTPKQENPQRRQALSSPELYALHPVDFVHGVLVLRIFSLHARLHFLPHMRGATTAGPMSPSSSTLARAATFSEKNYGYSNRKPLLAQS